MQKFLISLSLLAIIACAKSIINTSSDVANQKPTKKLRIKSIMSWDTTRTGDIYRSGISPDTLLFFYDTLGRKTFFKVKYHPDNTPNFACDSIRYFYDQLDSLSKDICYRRLKKKDQNRTATVTTIYTRDSTGMLLNEQLRFSQYPSLNIQKTYSYDSLHRIVQVQEKKLKRNYIKRIIRYQYLDSTHTCIRTEKYFKSYNLLSFINMDTFRYSSDSTLLRHASYTTRTHVHQYVKKPNCLNCIKFYHYKDRLLQHEIRISPPLDTIYQAFFRYDHRRNPVLWTTVMYRDTSKYQTRYLYDQQGNKIEQHSYLDGTWAHSLYRRYAYYD